MAAGSHTMGGGRNEVYHCLDKSDDNQHIIAVYSARLRYNCLYWHR